MTILPKLVKWSILALKRQETLQIINYQDINDEGYYARKSFKEIITVIKNEIRKTQIKAIQKVNSNLILLYFKLGKIIAENKFYEEYTFDEKWRQLVAKLPWGRNLLLIETAMINKIKNFFLTFPPFDKVRVSCML